MLVRTPHCFAAAMSLALAAPATFAENPYASVVVTYDIGSNPEPGYDNPNVVLGEPTRWTGEPFWPAVVSVFNPPWTPAEIVSIGAGGHITIQFESPVIDHPDHPFGIDFIVFGNTAFQDLSWGMAVVDGLFGNDGGIIEISNDGEKWVAVPKLEADGLFPTIGYLDSDAYDDFPGAEFTDFTLPVDPSLTLDDFMGLNYAQVLALYNGSGGGTGVDIGSVGFSSITHVRIRNPEGAETPIEIDGFAKVTPKDPPIPGDLNKDGVVDVLDVLILFSAWGECPRSVCAADLNRDGVVDVLDMLMLFANWG